MKALSKLWKSTLLLMFLLFNEFRTLPVAPDNVLRAVDNRTNKDRNQVTEEDRIGVRTNHILNRES